MASETAKPVNRSIGKARRYWAFEGRAEASENVRIEANGGAERIRNVGTGPMLREYESTEDHDN